MYSAFHLFLPHLKCLSSYTGLMAAVMALDRQSDLEGAQCGHVKNNEEGIVSGCSGCYNKTLKIGSLKPKKQKFVSHGSRKSEIRALAWWVLIKLFFWVMHWRGLTLP